jgi:hypothetical protein
MKLRLSPVSSSPTRTYLRCLASVHGAQVETIALALLSLAGLRDKANIAPMLQIKEQTESKASIVR